MNSEPKQELVRLRLQQAHDALGDARYLYEGGRPSQGVINRAYYAMFYATLALLQNIGKAPSKHSGVLGLFDTQFILKGVFQESLSRDFHRAFDLRQVSDCQPIRSVKATESPSLIQKAEAFVGVCEGD